MKTQSAKNLSDPKAGFSLLELVIVMAVIAMMIGVTVPVGGTVLRQKARAAATGELTILGEAVKSHFYDTGNLPVDHDDLLASTLPGWAGPYLTGVIDDRRTGMSGYKVDPWSRDYQWKVSGDVLTLTSAGSDGTFATATDIELIIDVTSIRRAITKERVNRLQIAINQYNAYYLTADPLTTQPLPANFAQIFTKLIAAGLVPTGSDLATDAWGDAFIPNPAISPVLAVTSSNL